MKKLFTLIAILCLTASVFAQTQTPRTLTWDGTEREYLEYVPTIYNAETPAPVVFCLHGLGDNMTNFSGLGFAQIADQTGWIVITPQALVATFPIIGEIGTAWNSGAGATGTPLGDLILNAEVDDTGFLMAILDSLENNFNINTDSVFFMGFSMGGFMANRLACEEGGRITAVASVSGTIGVGFNPNPQFPVKSLHFHGTADTQVGYDNADFDTGMGIYSVGMGAEELVEFWRNYNVCDVEPLMTYFPDTEADGKTFERYFYQNGTDGVFTAFIKVIGGDHEWYYTPQNDIDYTNEIYKFFTNTMDFPSNVENTVETGLNIYPNPATNSFTIYVENAKNTDLCLIDITGKIVRHQVLTSNESNIDISDLSEGLYVVRINENGKTSEQKLNITR